MNKEIKFDKYYLASQELNLCLVKILEILLNNKNHAIIVSSEVDYRKVPSIISQILKADEYDKNIIDQFANIISELYQLRKEEDEYIDTNNRYALLMREEGYNHLSKDSRYEKNVRKGHSLTEWKLKIIKDILSIDLRKRN